MIKRTTKKKREKLVLRIPMDSISKQYAAFTKQIVIHLNGRVASPATLLVPAKR